MHSKVIFEPAQSVVDQVTQLSSMTMAEIKSLWRELYGEAPPTHIRSFLERRLAYRLQERAFKHDHKDIAEKNASRIQALMHAGKKPLQPVSQKPIPGTVLSRLYQDKEYLVTVTHDNQFEFEGRLYKSLSVIAREITGTRWSGPLFFGLRKNNHKKRVSKGKKQ